MARSVNQTFKHFKITPQMDKQPEIDTPQISEHRYKRAIDNITLLRVMQEIDNEEVKRLISLIKSPDYENWNVAEECIKQKLS